MLGVLVLVAHPLIPAGIAYAETVGHHGIPAWPATTTLEPIMFLPGLTIALATPVRASNRKRSAPSCKRDGITVRQAGAFLAPSALAPCVCEALRPMLAPVIEQTPAVPHRSVPKFSHVRTGVRCPEVRADHLEAVHNLVRLLQDSNAMSGRPSSYGHDLAGSGFDL